jgi:hypothetical protein
MRTFIVGLASVVSLTAHAQTTDLAWQGRLAGPSGAWLEGAQDLRLSLWTAGTGGTQVFSQLYDDVVVSEGYVAVVLDDVPASAFVGADGGPRFLWVETALGASVLGPRQPMNAVPYATNLIGGSARLSGRLFLGTASDADCGGGTGEGAVVYDSARKVLRFCNGTSWNYVGETTVLATNGTRAWSDGTAAVSCNGYRNPPAGRAYRGDVGSGYYLIDPEQDGLALTRVYCDQDTSGGGWTAVAQCLPGDGCLSGTTRLYAVPWTGTSYGTPGDGASYVVGAPAAPVISAATQFMTEVRRTSNNAVGYLIFPMHSGFFTAGSVKSETSDVSATVIDTNGSSITRTMRTCWSPANSGYWVRSYRSQGGMTFHGLTATSPNTAGNSDCDYGAWDSQMLIRESKTTTATSMTTNIGLSPSTGWQASLFSHRVFVR